jgi:hypothetical protein
LKNRYGDPGTNKRFVVGIDRPKMRLYDVESNAQLDLVGTHTATEHKFNEKKSFGQLKV